MIEVNHKIQLLIIKHLLFHNGAHFTDLNVLKVPTDQLSYHIRRLLKNKVIKKDKGKYYLTPDGIKVSRKIDIEKDEIIVQPQVSIGLFIKKRINGQVCVLFIKRKRYPYKDYIGFPSTKVRFFEKLFDTARRCTKNELGISAQKLKYLGVIRKFHKGKNDPTFDRIFHYVEVLKYSGKICETEESKPFWLLPDQVKKYKKRFEELETIANLAQKGEMFFEEWKV